MPSVAFIMILMTFLGYRVHHQAQASVYNITPEQLKCGPMPNAMVALPNIGGALCSTPQSLAVAHCWSTVQ